jgi:peptidylprolyl isomerase
VSNSVRDRSGQSMLPKAERRALGKIAAAKRARAKRRKQLIDRITKIAVPFVVVLAVIGLTWWAIDSKSPATPEAEASASAAPTSSLPADADPALGIKPVVTAGTGEVTELKVTTLITGSGPAAIAGQSVTVNYVGVTYADGKEFDASWNSGEPFSFQLGSGGVIQGWDQGLVGVTVGSRVQLDIPQSMAYPNPTNGQPAGALRFVVDLLSVSGP